MEIKNDIAEAISDFFGIDPFVSFPVLPNVLLESFSPGVIVTVPSLFVFDRVPLLLNLLNCPKACDVIRKLIVKVVVILKIFFEFIKITFLCYLKL
jgi:hypothetical protein